MFSKEVKTIYWDIMKYPVVATLVYASIRTSMFIILWQLLLFPFNLPDFNIGELVAIFNLAYYLHPVHYKK